MGLLRLRLPIAILLVGLAALSGCRTLDRTVLGSRIPCGVYRWPIKTLKDVDASAIRWDPIQANVRDLASFSRPAWFERRHRNSNEYYVYRVEAELVAVHSNVDQDIHLLLHDPLDPKSQMVAEIPNPLCMKGTPYEVSLLAARRLAREIKLEKRKTFVEVVGVGFFDEYHEARGAAPNGFELHPVIRLTEIKPTTEVAKR